MRMAGCVSSTDALDLTVHYIFIAACTVSSVVVCGLYGALESVIVLQRLRNYRYIITRHSLVRAKVEVLVLLYVSLFVRFFVNDFSTTRGPIRAKVCMRAYSGSGYVFSPFWGLATPRGRNRGNEIFVTIGVNGEFLHFCGF